MQLTDVDDIDLHSKTRCSKISLRARENSRTATYDAVADAELCVGLAHDRAPDPLQRASRRDRRSATRPSSEWVQVQSSGAVRTPSKKPPGPPFELLARPRSIVLPSARSKILRTACERDVSWTSCVGLAGVVVVVVVVGSVEVARVVRGDKPGGTREVEGTWDARPAGGTRAKRRLNKEADVKADGKPRGPSQNLSCDQTPDRAATSRQELVPPEAGGRRRARPPPRMRHEQVGSAPQGDKAA